MSYGKISATIAALVVVGGLVFTFTCIERIPAGYCGIVYNMSGGVEDEVLTQGWHMVAPTKKVTKYSVAIEQGYMSRDSVEGDKDDSSFDIPTSDGKTINVDLEYSYHFDPENVHITFEKFRGQSGSHIESTFIRGKLKAWAGEISSTFPVTDIFGDKRQELNQQVFSHVSEKFKDYGIVMDSVNFTRIETDAETAAAIQKKVNAQQALELEKIQAETAQVAANKDKEVALINAQKDKEVALIAAEKEKEVAKANAEAAKIRGQGIADGNKAINESLTPQLLERQKLEKWDGKLPQIQGENSDLIVDVRD